MLRPACCAAVMSSSSCIMRSRLITGLPSDFFHPFFFQPVIHLVMELMAYWESARMLRSCWGSWVASKIFMIADNSPRLLLASYHPPAARLDLSMYHAQPACP